MFRILKDQRGFTLIELVIIIILIAVLAGVAIPRFVNLRDEAIYSKAKSIQDAGKSGITLDFANQILNNGSYASGISATGGVTGGANLTEIEANFAETPNYPPSGSYGTGCSGAGSSGFCWWVLDVGAASTPARVYGLYDGTSVDQL